jgi:predicted TIM-barrel fold metal-dependent hydrolase
VIIDPRFDPRFDPHYAKSNFPHVRPEWLALIAEPAVEPELAIIDPHHHLWDVPSAFYHAPELVADVLEGHRVLATVFVECKAHFDVLATSDLASVGETRFAVEQAKTAAALAGGNAGLVAGIVAYGDPLVADPHAVLAAHTDAGQGRVRGVRVRAAWHSDPAFAAPADGPTEQTISSPELDRYCAVLAEMGLTLDLWVYHTQLDQAAALAARHRGLTIILNHCGGPLGIGPYAGQQSQVRQAWTASLARVAAHPNVMIKIGGLAMPRTGMSFAGDSKPADSIEMVDRWAPYVRTCISLFDPERSMFESNFPVDKGSCSYVSLWNAFKLLCAGYPADQRRTMLAGTANRVYKLNAIDTVAVSASLVDKVA